MTTKKRKIDLSDDSFKELMQETYYEIVDQRNRALTAYKKWFKNTEENTDIAMVGKTVNELLKIVDSSLEKKIRLLKIQADVLYKNKEGGSGGNDDSGDYITDDDRKMVQEMLAKSKAGVTEVKKYE